MHDAPSSCSKPPTVENVEIFSPIHLPCGQVLPNRLVKVAMYEHLASLFGGPSNDYHYSLYSQWAKHGWGMLITGNVMVSRTHLTLGRDIVLPAEITQESLRPFRQLASCMHNFDSHQHRPLAIMQLNHAGRQSANILGGRYPFQPPLAPSSIRVGSDSRAGILSDLFNRILFQTPRKMTLLDINQLVLEFVHGARVAQESGFDGIQLHVAHGYILSQFLSPKANQRKDEYSCQKDNALRLLHQIVSKIREEVAPNFVLGIKMNAADYVTSSHDTDKALEHVLSIAQWPGIDFIEISGGDYEVPTFMKSIENPRQAFFARFSHQVMTALQELPQQHSKSIPLVLLTGGLRTPQLLCQVLASNHADLLGIGRGSVLCPDLPHRLQDRKMAWLVLDDTLFEPEPELDTHWILTSMPRIPLLGASIRMAWYTVMIRRMAMTQLQPAENSRLQKIKTVRPDYTIGGVSAVIRMMLWGCYWYIVIGAVTVCLILWSL